MNKKMRDLLLRSFDKDLSPEEHHILREAMAKSQTLREEQKETKRIRRIIRENSQARFQPFFTERVMGRISELESSNMDEPFFDMLLSFFKPVAVAVTICIVLLLSYNAIRYDGAILSDLQTSQDISLEEVFNPTLAYLE